MKLAISEVYGNTIQGEGPSLGRPCAFLRVAACNLSCTWCDTPFTWDWTRFSPKVEVKKLSIDEVVEKVLQHLPPGQHPLLVISGGEPLLQQDSLTEVLLQIPDVVIEVETAGTIVPKDTFAFLVDAFNVSPKLEHSGNAKVKRYNPAALDALRDTGKARWKFVAADPTDLYEVDEIVTTHGLDPVYIMPEGITQEAIEQHAKALVSPVIQRGWYLTPRLHIQLWGTERGH